MLEHFHIITFISSTASMAAKFALEEQGGFRLIPLPVEINASCGLCMKIETNFEEIFDTLKNKNIHIENVYQCKKTKEGLECTILTMQQPQ